MFMQKWFLYIIGLFFAVLYFYIHFDIEKWVYSKCEKYVDYIYQLFNQYESLGVFIIVFILVTLFINGWELWKDSYFSIKRFIIVVFGCIVWFLSLGHWSYITLYGWFRIDVFVSLVLLIYLGLLIYRSVNYDLFLQHRLVEENGKSIFSIDENRKEYAGIILQHIKQSAHDESYAVGLVGHWGSGKSCFLASLEQELYHDGQLIYFFNAWNSKTPDNIIVDFFNGLSDLLSPFYSNLQRPLLKYAELLTAVEAHSSIVYFINQLEHVTVRNLREEIIEALQSINKPIYILIDDIDRLTKEEVLEVMRLIRNTGNFPYLKYIAAYDKDYVESRLKDMNIPASYLNKIFSIELILPQLTEHIEGDIIKNILKQKIQHERVLRILSSCIDSLKHKYSLFFSDFRQVERFAQQCALNVGFVLSDDRRKKHDYNYGDLFYIELLKFSDRKIYERLQDNPELLLTPGKNSESHTSEYVFDIHSDKKDISEIQQGTIFLLEKIFGKPIRFKKQRNCMSFLENYDKYFSYGISRNKVSIGMFGHIILDSTTFKEVEEKVKNKLNNTQFVESLTNQFLFTVTYRMKVNSAKRYFDLCLILLEHTDKLNDLISERMQKDAFDNSIVPELSNYIMNQLNLFVEYPSYHLSVAKFLVKYLSFFDDDCCKLGVLSVSSNTILEMIRINAVNYLNVKSFDAVDIIRNGSLLNKFVEYHVIRKETRPYFIREAEIEYTYDNLIINDLISYFSHHQSEKIQEADEWSAIDSTVPDEYLEYEKSCVEIKIISLFGSTTNFDEYKAKCFV
jgi:GTPase SAR1 family protein